MKTINEYLISKTRHSKSFPDKFPDGFCLVIPFGNIFDVFYDEWYDVKLTDLYGGEPDAFLLKREDVLDYLDNKDVIVYKIPKKFETIEDLEEGYKYGKITKDKLEEIKTTEELTS